MTKLPVPMLVHQRVRQYFLNNGQYSNISTKQKVSKTFIDDYYLRSRRKQKKGKDNLYFENTLNTYFPLNRNWKIKKMKEDYYGIGLVATSDINQNEDLLNLSPIFSQVISTEKAIKSRDISVLQIDVSTPNSKNSESSRVFRMRGPVAFINHACYYHRNVRPKTSLRGNWNEWYACRAIKKGEQLFADYFDGGEDKIPCQFCMYEDEHETEDYVNKRRKNKRKRSNELQNAQDKITKQKVSLK
jgi:hypothetical protein